MQDIERVIDGIGEQDERQAEEVIKAFYVDLDAAIKATPYQAALDAYAAVQAHAPQQASIPIGSIRYRTGVNA